jgi:hypothetical protein
MKNPPNLKMVGQITSTALVFTSLGASLMLLLGNYKASFEILIRIDEIQIRIDTKADN